jgi:hypothetical protein
MDTLSLKNFKSATILQSLKTHLPSCQLLHFTQILWYQFTCMFFMFKFGVKFVSPFPLCTQLLCYQFPNSPYLFNILISFQHYWMCRSFVNILLLLGTSCHSNTQALARVFHSDTSHDKFMFQWQLSSVLLEI